MIVNSKIQPGDAVYARTKNPYGFMIRIGQALRWWKYREWNHMAIVESIDADGQIWVVQMARHCERVKIEDVAPGGRLKFVSIPKGVDRDRAVAFARAMIGIDYGVLTIVCIAINLLLPEPINFDIRREMTMICSALVARSWEHGGWICKIDPFTVTPAEMDKIQNGVGTIIQ